MTAYVIDIETNNLLSKMLDYTSIPYKLNKDARLWCIVVRNVDTNEVKHSSLTKCTKQWLQEALHDCTILITQNGVKFDQVALKLFGLLDYTIGYPADNERPATHSTLFGKPIEVHDVLLWSRLFYPDRYGGHSLKAWGERLGQYKGDYHDFDNYSKEMLDYCIQDTLVTALVYKKLLEDWNGHDWSKAYAMELKLADLAIRRETFGFKFDKELALSNLAELEVIMRDLTDKVNPLLPPKPLNKGQQDYYTPPKIQFKKNGDISSHMINFAEKIGAEIKERALHYNGKEIELPCTSPVADSVVATIDDMDWVKQHLLNLGWTPTEWKERDLTKDSKKQPLSAEKRVEALDRWWAETIGGKYTKQRFYELDMPPTLKTYDKLKEKLNDKWPVRVPTSPCVRVGVEKNICPNLIKMGSKVDFAQDFAHYLTYKHRRNSIAGGIDEDFDFDEEAPPTGYLSMLREDGRVSTPAIEIGASTNRYKHISICNIPRATSLFGEKMRAMFCCGDGGYQLGFDFASLENVIQGHHVLPYDGEELARQLVAEKPNDIHSINAKKLGISRGDAKSITYALLYGCSVSKLKKMLNITDAQAKLLYEQFWDAVLPLKLLKERLTASWQANNKKFILAIDGRKLFVRSQHSILNMLFQGNGVLCAKWTNVLLFRNLEEMGFRCNPFDSEVDIVSMIEYHDEQQLYVRKNLVKFKVYEDEETAKKDKLNYKQSSAVAHSKKYYFCENNLVTTEIYKAITTMRKLLGLKTNLGIEWSVGRNWLETH